MEELGDDARAPLLGGVEAVEAGADPVEGAEQAEVEAVLLAVAPDDAIEELLGAGVDPALHLDGAEHQLRLVGVERGVVAHAVDLRGGGEQHALTVADAVADDGQVGLEVELEHRERVAHVGGRGGDGHQRQHDVALLDVVLHPLAVDGDVALEEVEAGVVLHVGDAVRVHVHAEDMPVGGIEDTLGQVVSDEAVDAQNQYIHADITPVGFRLIL